MTIKIIQAESLAKLENDATSSPEEIFAMGAGALRRAAQEGDANGSYMAGECAGMVRKSEPAKTIVEDLIFGAESIISRFVAERVK